MTVSDPSGPDTNRGTVLVIAGVGVLVAILAAVVAILEFGDGDDGAAQTTSTGQPSTTTVESTTTTDPYAIPDQIDVDYVNRVLQALFEVETAALRDMMAADAVTPGAEDRFQAIAAPEALSVFTTSAQDAVQTGFAEIRRPPGSPIPNMTELLVGTPSCIAASGTEDASPRVTTPGREALPSLYVLVPLDPTLDPQGFNPTPWTIARALIVDDRNLQEARSRCGAA